MTLFTHSEFDNHEQVIHYFDKPTGLKAIIAIHNTNLGSALGGCRMWNYANDDEALTDVLRLSKGMTYKAAITGLPLGGGKSVIIGDAKTEKTPKMMQAMGRAVEKLSGRYIIAEDVNTTVDDMVNIHKYTNHVVGLPSEGTKQAGGNPSPLTALGVFLGLKATVKHRLGKNSIAGLRVAVQGLGNVGYNLCERLHEEGAELFVTDINDSSIQKAVNNLGATAVALNDIYSQDVDVFAPCALGGIINDDTIPQIKATVVAGAANNQMATSNHIGALKSRNILYAPDFVINAGGLINVYYEHESRINNCSNSKKSAMEHINYITTTIEEIFKYADVEDISTALAANKIAESRFLTGNTEDKILKFNS